MGPSLSEVARSSQSEERMTCSVGQRVQCPGSSDFCAGDQCCPGINGGATFPCPSASPYYAQCASHTKVYNCLSYSLSESAEVGRGNRSLLQSTPSLSEVARSSQNEERMTCSVGQRVQCPGSSDFCAGDQCCP